MMNIPTFLSANPGLDLRNADLSSADGLARYNWPEETDRDTLLDALRIRQRLLKIYPDEHVAAKLESLGIYSAHHIVSMGETAFAQKAMPELGALDGVQDSKALCAQISGNAARIRRASLELALARPRTMALAVTDPAGEGTRPDFQEGIPDYQRLFGPMTGRDCEECESIFGPAAYFADLMRVVTQHIGQPLEKHFTLRYRRPDLWDIPLDCINSETEVSYLDIVNVILQRHLQVNYTNGEPPLHTIAGAVYPFSAPFSSPLLTIRGALKELGVSLGEIHKLLETAAPAAAAEALNLSPEQLMLINGQLGQAEGTNAVPLSQLYGFHDTAMPDSDLCESLSRQRIFLRQTGLLPEQLDELVYQHLRQGNSGYVMQNNGSQDIATNEFLDSKLAESITVECWICPTASYSTMSIVGKSATGEFITWLDDHNLFHCRYNTSGTHLEEIVSSAKLSLNAWTHVAWTRDVNTGTNLIYINGILNSTHQAVVSAAVTSDSPIVIGYISEITATSFHGGITELRLWSGVRTASQIQTMMRTRLKDYAQADLFAYWPLNESTGTIAHDLGPHHYNAPDANFVYYASIPLGSAPEITPAILHGFFLNNLLPPDQFITITAADYAAKTGAQLQLKDGSAFKMLSDTALSQIAVYIRLQAQTGWSFEELDWLLKSVAGTQKTVNDTIIESMGVIATLRKKYNIAPDEFSSFWCDMKTYGRGNSVVPEDLWDRVYNAPPMMAQEEEITEWDYYRPVYASNPLFTSTVFNWAFKNSTNNLDQRLNNHFVAALGISGSELAAIVSSVTTESSIPLTVENLSLLYRIARFAQMLRMKTEDFISLVELLGLSRSISDRYWTLQNVQVICECAEWLKREKLTMDQLIYLTITNAPAAGLGLPDMDSVVTAVEAMIATSTPVLVTPALFIAAGVDMEEGDTVYDQLVATDYLMSCGLVTNVNKLTPENISDALKDIGPVSTAEATSICDLLIQSQNAQNSLVIKSLASLTSADADTMAGVCSLSGSEVDNASAFGISGVKIPYAPNMLLNSDEATNPHRNAYLSVLQYNGALTRWFKLTGEEASNIGLYSAKFGKRSFTYGKHLFTMAQLMRLSDYKALQNLCAKKNGLIDYFADAPSQASGQVLKPTDEQITLLAGLTGWNTTELNVIINSSCFSKINFNTVAGVRKIADVMETEQRTGMTMSSLLLLQSLSGQGNFKPVYFNWQNYEDAKTTVNAALSSKMGSQAVASNNAGIQVQTRDVLCAWLIWNLETAISGVRDVQELYEYLLIDVNMSQDVNTSRMVAAMNSLQLYVNRLINNLEPGAVNDIPERWWEWMSAYRVWQANRKVYLYPENYVDPTLRKFQSPEFKTFISDVSKGQITDENVKQALANYLESVNDVASLELIDGYVEPFSLIPANASESNGKRAIYLIGRSRTAPAVFYSRTAIAVTSNTALSRGASKDEATYMHFGPWQQINLQISSNYVSTVVAFGRQFIFWVEQTEIINSNSDNSKYTSVHATIYYSYRDFSGKWAAPVVFKKDLLVGIFGSQQFNYYDSYFEGARMGDSQTGEEYYKARDWNEVKVQALPATETENETILVTFGPLVTCPASMESGPDKPDTSKMNAVAADYQNTLYKAATRAYNRKGNITTIIPVHTLNNAMNVNRWDLSLDRSNVTFVDYSTLPLDGKTGLLFFTDTPVNDAEFDNSYRAPDACWPMVMNLQLVSERTIKSIYTDTPGTFSTTPHVLEETTPEHTALQPVNFNGSLYASIPWKSYQSRSKFTVSCWVYLSGSSSASPKNQNLLSMIYNKAGWDVSVVENAFQFGLGQSSGENTSNRFGKAENNKWYFLALTVNANGSVTATINDQSYSVKGTYVPIPTANSSYNLYMGRSYYNQSYSLLIGSIINLKIWKTPLLEQELLSEYYSKGMHPGNMNIRRLGNTAAGFLYNEEKQSYLLFPEFETSTLGDILVPIYHKNHENLDVVFSRSPVEADADVTMRLVRVNTDTLPTLIHTLARGGVNELLKPSMQYLREEALSVVVPSEAVRLPESDLMNFSGAFGTYFWEVFFYAPYVIAEKLRTGNKYPEAKKWYQYIFDPTSHLGPVGCWPLNRTIDEHFPDLKRGLPATYSGITAMEGQTVEFDYNPRTIWRFDPALDSQVIVPYSSLLNPGAFTVMAWIKIENIPVSSATIINSQNGSSGYRLFLTNSSETTASIVLTISTNTSEWLNAVSYPVSKTGKWIYVAGRYDGSSLSVFIDGADQTQQRPSPDSGFIKNISAAFCIGSGNSDTPGGSNFNGSIAGVMLFDYALQDAELCHLYKDYRNFSVNANYWNFRPFRRVNAESLYHILNGDTWQESFFQPAEYYTASLQMAVYEYDPFDPDTLARLRVNSWQKAAFTRYMENLVSWGDSLFTQDTWESRSEATMRYVLAATLLGRMPIKKVTREPRPTVDYNSIEAEYGEGNAPSFLIEMENQLSGLGADATMMQQVQSIIDAYFSIPVNDQLMKYWDLVADRLYKLRHGLSITGAPDSIPLYAAPLNPNALVAAAAMGAQPNKSSNAVPAIPWFRFSYMIAQAKSVVAEVVRLGNELLTALEKKDAEHLAQLQTGYQLVIYNLTNQIKASQINQIQYTGEGLKESYHNAEQVHNTYRDWMLVPVGPLEALSLLLTAESAVSQEIATVARALAVPGFLLPSIFGLADGGMSAGDSLNIASIVMEGEAHLLGTTSQMLAQTGQYVRRELEWNLQRMIAGNQMKEIAAQIKANDFALQAALTEARLNQTQLQQSQEIYQFLKEKFTSEELYDWMAGQLSMLYFQMFQLAWSLGQSAQTALQYELNLNQSYLNPAAWNAGYQGLLAGDTLSLALQQMENAYISGNNRKLEIRKTWSMRQNDPQAFLNLVSTGKCRFDLNELSYDLDFPGHYNRKIKSLSITIPAVVGPYQNIHATLIQTGNVVALKPNIAAVEYLLGITSTAPSDGSLRINWNPNQEIIISTGINDAGIFQLNFNDEQYLPFEGTGAISSWSLSIPQASNSFPLRSISDIIISVEYIAEDGGSTYSAQVTGLAPLKNYKGWQYLNMRQLYSTAWFEFCSNPVDGVYSLPFELVTQMYPANLLNGTIMLGDDKGKIALAPVFQQGYVEGPPSFLMNDSSTVWKDGMLPISDENKAEEVPGKGNPWTLKAKDVPAGLLSNGKIDQTKLLDIILIIPFSGTLNW